MRAQSILGDSGVGCEFQEIREMIYNISQISILFFFSKISDIYICKLPVLLPLRPNPTSLRNKRLQNILIHDPFAEITFCPSINQKEPVTFLVLFLTYQLSCGMRYLILSVPLSLLVLKENPSSPFVPRLFFFIYDAFSYVSVYAM